MLFARWEIPGYHISPLIRDLRPALSRVRDPAPAGRLHAFDLLHPRLFRLQGELKPGKIAEMDEEKKNVGVVFHGNRRGIPLYVIISHGFLYLLFLMTTAILIMHGV